MDVAPYLLSTKQHGLQKEMVNLSFNIANAQNHGFKARNIFYTPWTQTFSRNPQNTIRQASYPIQSSEWKNEKHGQLKKTENPLQVGLSGSGFLELSDGTFTRNGNLLITPEGVVTNVSGIPFVNADGTELVIPGNPSEIRINYAGQIFDKQNNNLGRFRVVSFEDLNNIRTLEDSRVETDDPPLTDTDTRVMQGFIESSNVEVPLMMTRAQATVTQHQQINVMKKNFYDTQHRFTKQLVSLNA